MEPRSRNIISGISASLSSFEQDALPVAIGDHTLVYQGVIDGRVVAVKMPRITDRDTSVRAFSICTKMESAYMTLANILSISGVSDLVQIDTP